MNQLCDALIPHIFSFVKNKVFFLLTQQVFELKPKYWSSTQYTPERELTQQLRHPPSMLTIQSADSYSAFRSSSSLASFSCMAGDASVVSANRGRLAPPSWASIRRSSWDAELCRYTVTPACIEPQFVDLHCRQCVKAWPGVFQYMCRYSSDL